MANFNHYPIVTYRSQVGNPPTKWDRLITRPQISPPLYDLGMNPHSFQKVTKRIIASGNGVTESTTATMLNLRLCSVRKLMNAREIPIVSARHHIDPPNSAQGVALTS